MRLFGQFSNTVHLCPNRNVFNFFNFIGHEQGLDQGQDDQAEWHEVGAKNRSLLTRRVGNSNETIRTPMGQIFQGQIQSCVTSSNGEPTATLQPFFTLPLDIQSKSIKNVSDALIHNFTAETLDG